MARGFSVACGLMILLTGNIAQASEPFPPARSHPMGMSSDLSDLDGGPLERRDLAKALGAAFCDRKAVDSKTLWEWGIFDAQIEGRLLNSEKLTPEHFLDVASRRAQNLARRSGFGGYGYGICPDGRRAWALAVPSPVPMSSITEQRKLSVPQSTLRARCSEFRVDFADKSGGIPKRILWNSTGQIDVSKLSSGVISMTCQPKLPKWQGPVLWYLTPVGELPDENAPEILPAIGGTLDHALATWIIRIRVKEHLRPLALNKDLSQFAAMLAEDGSLVHNRAKQSLVSQNLKKHGLSPIGEDRVRAKDLQTMVWLLWNSPRHRALLLNPEASAIGIGLRAAGDEMLAVILAGNDSQNRKIQ